MLSFADRSADDHFSGNGGLSLRRVSAIRRVLGFQERYNDTEPEDEWFGKRIYLLPGAKVAAGMEGALAVEDIYMEKPMGYHIKNGGQDLNEKVWKTPDQRKKIFDYCPELSLIMDMKLERERCPGDNQQGKGTIRPTPAEQKAKNKDLVDEIAQRKKQQEAALKKLQEDRDRKKLEAIAAKQAAMLRTSTSEQAGPPTPTPTSTPTSPSPSPITSP